MVRLPILRVSTVMLAASAAVLVNHSTANAQFVLIENFEDVALGADLSANNVGENFTTTGTTTPANIFLVQQDPTNAINKLLAYQPSTLNLFGYAPLAPQNGDPTLTLAEGTTGTLFFRLRRSAQGTPINYNIGLSDETGTTAATSSYESQLNFQSSTINVRDVGAFTPTQTFAPEDWYGFFMVVDNLTDTTKFYIQPSSAAAPTLLTGGDNSFGFRNGLASSDLGRFLIYQQANQNPLFLDDVYFDPNGANLTAPVAIPEPGTSLLLCGAVALVGGFRRRRA